MANRTYYCVGQCSTTTLTGLAIEKADEFAWDFFVEDHGIIYSDTGFPRVLDVGDPVNELVNMLEDHWFTEFARQNALRFLDSDGP